MLPHPLLQLHHIHKKCKSTTTVKMSILGVTGENRTELEICYDLNSFPCGSAGKESALAEERHRGQAPDEILRKWECIVRARRQGRKGANAFPICSQGLLC